MTGSPYLAKLEIEYYRNIKKISLDRLKRFNVIGGSNGTGKSSLLEAVFLLLGRSELIALMRGAVFRNFASDFESTRAALFWRGRSELAAKLSANILNNKKLVISVQYGRIHPGVSNFTPFNPMHNMHTSSLTSDSNALYLSTKIDGRNDGEVAYTPANQGMNVTIIRQFELPSPRSVLLNSTNRHGQGELATRFTDIVKGGLIKDLIKMMQIVQPSLTSLQLLQTSGQPLIHGDLGFGLIPINLMGDGAVTLASIFMGIVACPGGVILLDEFDTAIHYSKLPDVWRAIRLSCTQYNVQLFAVTHSRECIQAANRIFVEDDCRQELTYTRIDKSEDGVIATTYDSEELDRALEHEWEIR